MTLHLTGVSFPSASSLAQSGFGDAGRPVRSDEVSTATVDRVVRSNLPNRSPPQSLVVFDAFLSQSLRHPAESDLS